MALEEIIFCFDQDEAGKKAVGKYSQLLREHLSRNQEVRISSVELPNNDINETLQLHNEEIFLELLEKRIALQSPNPIENNKNNEANFLFSNEKEGGSSPTDSANNAGFISNQKNTPTEFVRKLSATEFLQQKDLLKSLNQLIEKSGIIGEENSRLLLFLITISYLNKSPLHGIVQGSSGSGKTRATQPDRGLDATGRCLKVYENYRIKFIQLGRVRPVPKDNHHRGSGRFKRRCALCLEGIYFQSGIEKFSYY
ncbi:toprim domain-containing protein [Halpernia sp. GG3]